MQVQGRVRKYQYKIKRVDLTDFCSLEGEFISDDGLSCLIRDHVCGLVETGWEFQDLQRSEQDPCIIRLHFRREA